MHLVVYGITEIFSSNIKSAGIRVDASAEKLYNFFKRYLLTIINNKKETYTLSIFRFLIPAFNT